jgi:hypothetical protein
MEYARHKSTMDVEIVLPSREKKPLRQPVTTDSERRATDARDSSKRAPSVYTTTAVAHLDGAGSA